jgi:arylsulfatase A-like enzyme
MARSLGRALTIAIALGSTSVMAQTGGPTSYPVVQAPPAGTPNVLIVMTDDVGFAASSTFGGAIPTPTFDALAADGLRYNNFHTTAICSATRAALLTGRNHHAVGFGNVADIARNEPGYNSILPKGAGTIGQILSAAGFDTAMFGKNHNVPTWQAGPLGPFDQWGSGLGFKYFYGFNAGLTNQFFPALVENNTAVEPPRQDGYVLDRDLADHAISWLRMQRAGGGGRPFLLYYAPGTAHAPIQAPADWIARFKGKFDGGWDVLHQQIFERQKRLGIIPADARLAPMPANVKRWDALTPDEKRVASRYMEAYAAMLAYCDSQIGRVIGELKASGQLDNTLVIYIQGDNGSSAEGGQIGTYDYQSKVSGRGTSAEKLQYALAHLDDIGGPRSYEVGPVGWALAMDTPFPYYKAVASHLGGMTNGMVVSWPARIKARGLRSQFADATDILPTVLDATGVKPPETLRGYAQSAFDGTSFTQTFTDARAPSRHATQYFEIMGNAAIYHDGWLASAQVSEEGEPGGVTALLDKPWQLFDLTRDFSQTQDVSAHYPDKLKELQALFQTEGTRNHVLPFFTKTLQALLPGVRPEIVAPGSYTYYPSDFRYPEGAFPSINNRSWSIEADLDVPASGGNGVLVTQGGRASGWGLVVLKGVPTFLYRATDRDADLFRLAAPQPVGAGHHHVTVGFTVDAPGFAKGGLYTLSVDGREVARGHADSTVPFKFAPEDAVVGHDTGTTLSDDYQTPFAYDGTLRSLTITLSPQQLAAKK